MFVSLLFILKSKNGLVNTGPECSWTGVYLELILLCIIQLLKKCDRALHAARIGP